MANRVLINTANLHVGGGVQVATSFIYEMTQLSEYDFSNINIITSTIVNHGLSKLNVDTRIFQSYRVMNLIGVQAFCSPLNREIEKYDVVFTVFGPNYLRVQSKKEIVGFAQLWILEFDNILTKRMRPVEKIKQKMKRFLQWKVFDRADIFIVELEHVKNKLVQKKNKNSSDVEVVYNAASSLYVNRSQWSDVVVEKNDADLHLGIVSRDYSHKNLSVFPQLAQLLFDNYDLQVRFYVTFTDLEWSARDDEFKKYVTNVGELLPNECPSFYQQMDGVFFPSLLECFSATPLEALIMEKPLFASDRDFVRDVCGDHAMYFDPLDLNSMVEAIASFCLSNKDNSEHLVKAKHHAACFSNAKDRAIKYLEIINNV